MTTRARISQLEEVNRFLKAKSLDGKVDKFPPNRLYTFKKIGESRIKDENTLDVKLFCGEIPEYQTWAIVKEYKKKATNKREKATEVLFINEFATGEKGFVTELKDMALMYPFKGLKKHDNGTDYPLRQLKTIILYLFLDQGHTDRVFPSEFKSAKQLLSSAIKRISNDYDAKGIANVPNLHHPGEDFSFQRGAHARPAVTRTVKKYNDNTKTIVSENDTDVESAVVAGQPPAEDASLPIPPPNDIGPPSVPAVSVQQSANVAPSELESMFESVSIAGRERPRTGTKRRADDDEGFADFLYIKRQCEEINRKDTALMENTKKEHATNRAKTRELTAQMEAILKKRSKATVCKWMMKSEAIPEEIENEE